MSSAFSRARAAQFRARVPIDRGAAQVAGRGDNGVVMHLNRTLVAAAVGVALGLSAIPASAQRRGVGGGGSRGSGASRGAAQGGSARAGVGRATAGPRGAGVDRGVAVPRASVAGPYSRGSYGPRGGY